MPAAPGYRATVRANRAVGTITRGTTNPNRLRRCDRWLLGTQSARLRGGTPERPAVVVDLGYGASPVTTLELAARLHHGMRGSARGGGVGVVGDLSVGVKVVGLEIDPERVAHAREVLATERRTPAGRTAPGVREPARVPVEFGFGGFEVPLPPGSRLAVVRAFNVLRQYDESEVVSAWATMTGRLAPDGILIDGTCDELGRRMTWVLLDRSGPISLTISVALPAIETPSDVAERLPKALIHRNVPGERIHALLHDWDAAWRAAAPLASFGRRQRFVASVRSLRAAGWPVLGGPARWRLGEMSVAWEAVRPR